MHQLKIKHQHRGEKKAAQALSHRGIPHTPYSLTKKKNVNHLSIKSLNSWNIIVYQVKIKTLNLNFFIISWTPSVPHLKLPRRTRFLNLYIPLKMIGVQFMLSSCFTGLRGSSLRFPPIGYVITERDKKLLKSDSKTIKKQLIKIDKN